MRDPRTVIEPDSGRIEHPIGRSLGGLDEDRERLLRLLAAAPIGIFATDEQGHHNYANDCWYSVLGLRPEDDPHACWIRAVHPDDAVMVSAMWAAAWTTGRDYSHPHRIVTANGEVRWVHAQAAPQRGDESTATNYTGTIEDITDRRLTEEGLVLAREAAIAAGRLKSEFVANMSHEIRTPMTAIIGMTELALDTPLDDEQQGFLMATKSAADSLLTLLNDILDFSKIEAGKLELEAIPFCLRECAASAAKSLAVRAHPRGLELVFDVAADVPDRLIGDPTRFRQVIVNLVGNAIKFTERGEVVLRITCRDEREGRVTLECAVSDTGIGIPVDKQAAVFESFTQAEGSTTRHHGGTGLGLAICRQLVELMGGALRLESRPGQGSTFTFSAVLGVDAGEQALLPTSELVGKRVLVIDDNMTHCGVFTQLLERWGARGEAAHSGAAGIAAIMAARAQAEPFDLVLLDAGLPEVDGFAVAEQIRGDSRLRTPILLLTSVGCAGDAARCRALGIAGYLTKPVTGAELFEAIGTVIGLAGAGRAEALVTRHLLKEDRARLRLLLAEDNAVNRGMIARILEKRGHSVLAVEDGVQVMAALEQETFDVVITDLQMPNMDGFQTAAAIRARDAEAGTHTPILALTAHAMKGDRERCLAHGMDGYASKPIQARELLDAIAGLVPEQPASERLAAGSLDAPRTASGSRVFDLAAARLYADGDDTLLAMAVTMIMSDAPRRMEEIEHALSAGDTQAAMRAAHSLRGGFAQIGARRAATAAERLESRAADNDIGGARSAFVGLHTEFERLRPEVQQLFAAA